jgi:predicted transporter
MRARLIAIVVGLLLFYAGVYTDRAWLRTAAIAVFVLALLMRFIRRAPATDD